MFLSLLVLLALDAITFANAGLFVVKPLQGSTCQAGKPCSVDWLDDGIHPLLAAIGVVHVGLYHGKQQLVQTISAVNVATAHSLTFIPIPGAGPNADDYYISMVSTSVLQNTSLPYAAFSSFFRLEGMTGSFDAPDPVATSSISIPSSVATSGRPVQTAPVLSTITVGAIPSTTSVPKPPSSSKSAHTLTLLRSLSASAAPSVESSLTAPASSASASSAPASSAPASSAPTSSAPTSSVDAPASSSPTLSVNFPTNDPITLSVAPSGFSTLISPSSIVLPAVESLTSPSVPLPSAPVANSPNGAAACLISRAITIFPVVATLHLLMAF